MTLYEMHQAALAACSSPGEDVVPMSAELSLSGYIRLREKLSRAFGVQIPCEIIVSDAYMPVVRFGEVGARLRQKLFALFPPETTDGEQALSMQQKYHIACAVLSGIDALFVGQRCPQ